MIEKVFRTIAVDVFKKKKNEEDTDMILGGTRKIERTTEKKKTGCC